MFALLTGWLADKVIEEKIMLVTVARKISYGGRFVSIVLSSIGSVFMGCAYCSFEHQLAGPASSDAIKFTIPQRWVTVSLGFLGIFNAFSMRVCLSIAIIEMTLPHNNSYNENTTLNNTHLESAKYASALKYDWSERTQGVILSSFYWGYVFSCILGGAICQKFGGKHTLGLGILFTSLFTIATPHCTYWGGATGLIVLRLAMGFGEGTTYPAVTYLLAHWIPEDERSKAGTLAFSGASLGTIFGMFMSGVILQYSESGWPMVFYFYGTVGIIFFLLNTAFCYNRPSENPYISDEELTYLENKLNRISKTLPSTPWFSLLKSPPVWASIIAKAGTGWGYVTLISDMPKFMSSILKISARDNGYLSSIPYLATTICSGISSWVTDKVITEKKLSVTTVRKIGCAVASFGPAIFLVAASYAGSDSFLVIALQTVAAALMGCIFCSVFVNALDLSPNYASSIMGLGNGVATISGALSPYLVGVLTPNQTIDEWRLVFWIVGAIYVVSGIVFLIFGSGKLQEWNDSVLLNKKKVADVDGVQIDVELLPLKKP